MLICSDASEAMQKLRGEEVKLTMFSPPYAEKMHRYGDKKKKMSWVEWSIWMSHVVEHACRLTDGFVIVVANNPVKNGQIFPANEKLMTLLHERGVKLERPIIWHKNSAPNTRPWWVNDWEPVMAFYTGDRPTTWNWEAVAKPKKYKNGGNFSHRNSDGTRKVNGGAYPTHELARPRDVLRVTVGGGHMGSPLASENEAPYPEKLVEPFVLALTNPGDTVLDIFAGSGTTLAVAKRLGRKWIGVDNRQSQIDLCKRRLEENG